MNLFTWHKGRQVSCEYYKMPILLFKLWKIGFDCYILKYKPDSLLPSHKDPINGRHYRLNIKLRGQSDFICEKTIFHNSFMSFFRPDLYLHSLKTKTKTLKISFGFAIFA